LAGVARGELRADHSGLALLALFYPLLLGLSAFTDRLFGLRLPALGFLPSLLALTLYSILPILRNAVTGLTGLDPAVMEAASAVGMTSRQRLFRVEVPLAAPVVMAGIRTAAVWTIGAATLSTSVGQTSLGNYIFSGLQTENWIFVLFGCAVAAAFAFVVDQILGLIEAGATRRDAKRICRGGVDGGGRCAPLLPQRTIGQAKNSATIHPGQLISGTKWRRRARQPNKAVSAPPSRFDALTSGDIDVASTIPARFGPTSWSAAIHLSDRRCSMN
jgi:osmoprotectant transport system permease protein